MVNFDNLWTGADWAILLIYFVAVLGVGFVMHKRASKNFKSFFVASRRLTIPVLIGVAMAGWYDSWTIVGLAECGWTMGISIIFIYVVPTGLMRLPLAIWVGPLCRDVLPDYVVTLPDMIGYFYDRKTKLVSCIVPVFSVLYSAALLFAVGDVLHMVSGLPIFATVIIAGLAVVLYTAMAGLWALAVTDMIQFVVMTVAAAILAIGLLAHFGGMENIWSQVEAVDPALVRPLGHNGPMDVLAWVVGAMALYVNAQSYQRFGASRGSGEIKVAYSIMLGVGIAFSGIMVFCGMAAMIMFPEAQTVSAGFWGAVFTVLPPGMRGLFVAALIAAVMSTSSADILISAGILAKDVIKDVFKPDMSEKSVLTVTRVCIVLVGIFIIAGTYLWRDGIANAWYYIGGFQVAVFLIPILGGFFYKRKTALGGFITVMIGIAFYIVWEFILKSPMGIPSNSATWIASIVAYFIVCPLTYKAAPQDKIESK